MAVYNIYFVVNNVFSVMRERERERFHKSVHKMVAVNKVALE